MVAHTFLHPYLGHNVDVKVEHLSTAVVSIGVAIICLTFVPVHLKELCFVSLHVMGFAIELSTALTAASIPY